MPTKSFSFRQREILESIIRLYVPAGRFDLDPKIGRAHV